MRRLLFLAPVVALLAGCDGGLYYQTRYIPTDIDSSFTVEAVAWNGDREVIELPALPPDIDATHRARVECQHPYQKFKPTPMVRYKEPAIKSNGIADLQPVAKMSDYERPVGPNTVLAGPKVSGFTNSPYAPGVTQRAFRVDISDTDRRPHSTTGAGTTVNPNTLKVNGGLNSHNYNPYCCGDGFGKGTTNANIGPGK